MLTVLEPAARDQEPASVKPLCRLCGARLHRTLIDLGCMPLASHTLAANEAECRSERSYPLRARVCDTCLLVQIEDVAAADQNACRHAFLSSRSATCVDHARRFATVMRQRLGLDTGSLVIEIASNDGYLLRHFQDAQIPVLGIEAALNAAVAARSLGIPTEIGCFNAEVAMDIAVRHGRADLVIADNVLSQVPDLFDFVAGFVSILRPKGIVTFQFPHLLAVIEKRQFDAFRHDRYSYLSLLVLEHVLRSVGLRVFDAERLPDHGGSLRVFACHARASYAARPSLRTVRLAEATAGLDQPEGYGDFAAGADSVWEEVREFLRTRRLAGRRVAAYGAAARGNTLLNCCGITATQIVCVADPDPDKHGRLLPGSHIPIVAPAALIQNRPDDVIILPWPSAPEIAAGLLSLRQKGTRFWTAMPALKRV